MDNAAEPVGYRIDINTAAGNAYRSLFENAGLAASFGGLPLAIVLVIEFLAYLALGGGLHGQVLSGIARALGMLVFGTVFLTRWYRFRLLGETQSRGFFTPAWKVVVVVSFQFAGLLMAGTFVLFVIAALPPHVLTAPLAILGAVAMAVAAVRVSLVFPAAAIEEPILFRTAWEMLAGNYWRLLACVFLCYVPFAIVEGALDRAGDGKGLFAAITIEIVALAIEFAGMAVLASLFSEVYRAIVDDLRVGSRR